MNMKIEANSIDHGLAIAGANARASGENFIVYRDSNNKIIVTKQIEKLKEQLNEDVFIWNLVDSDGNIWFKQGFIPDDWIVKNEKYILTNENL